MQLNLQSLTNPQEIKELASSSFSKDNLELAQQAADQLFSLKQYLDAIKIYQEIIERTPEKDYEISGLGNNQEQIGYYEWDSYSWYKEERQKKIIKGNPYDALSLCCLANSKYQAGIPWYRDMACKYTKNYQIIFGYANILYNNSIYEEAINNYEFVIKLRPNFVKPHVDLALLYEYRRIQKRKSTQKSREILEMQPNNQYALFILARNENDIDKKIQKLKTAWQLNPKYTRVCNQVGICYGGVKKMYEQAIKWYTKCTEINPKYSSCYNNIGVNNQLLKRYEQAEKWYFRGVEADNQYKTAYKNLTDVFDHLKYTDQQILKQSKSYKVGEDIFCYYIGLSYYDKSKVEKSITWIERAINQNMKEHRFYNSLAISYDEIKDYQKAIFHYKKCIELQPSYYSAYYNLAIVYKSQGNQDEAIKWYIKSTEINPRYSYAYNNLGNIYKKNENYPQAIKYYQKAIEFNSTYTLAFINLGVCHLFVQEFKQASQMFQRAQEIVNTDNNNLSESNKEFIRPHLSKYELQGFKWRKFGTLTAEDKERLVKITSEFEQSFSKENMNLQISQKLLKSKELTEMFRLLVQGQFQMVNFKQTILYIQSLYSLDTKFFSIIPSFLFQFFWKKKFQEGVLYEDIEVEIQNNLSRYIQEQVSQLQIDKDTVENEVLISELFEKHEAIKPDTQDNRFNLFEEVSYFVNYDRVFSEIINVHKRTLAQFPSFEQFLTTIQDRNKESRFIASTRIPADQTQQFAAILGIFQEIFMSQLGDGVKSQITAIMNVNLNQLPSISRKRVAEQLYQTWCSQLTQIFLRERMKNNEETYCYVTDFAEGTCLFQSIKDLCAALEFVYTNSKAHGFQVLYTENNLQTKQICDVKLVLRRHTSIFTLRFQLQSSHERINFIRQIKKIQKSPFGFIFACLLASSTGKQQSLKSIAQNLIQKIPNIQAQSAKLLQLSNLLVLALPTQQHP